MGSCRSPRDAYACVKIAGFYWLSVPVAPMRHGKTRASSFIVEITATKNAFHAKKCGSGTRCYAPAT